MSQEAFLKIEAGLREARKIAAGEIPAPRIYSHGHWYVPEARLADVVGKAAVGKALAPETYTIDHVRALLLRLGHAETEMFGASVVLNEIAGHR